MRRGAAQLGVALTETAAASMLDYLALLVKWNRVYNLTAVRDPAQMVTRHLLDSLSVLPFVDGPRVVDVGAGAGFPGMPLALAQPGWRVTLLDSNGKRTRFLRQAVALLGINNVEVVQRRAEDYRPGDKFDTLVCRAFGGVAALLDAAGHLVRPGGSVLLMQGRAPAPAAMAEAREGFSMRGVERLRVPGLKAQRHVLILMADEAVPPQA